MSGIYYVLAANICVWLAIFGYLIHLQLKYRKLQDLVEVMKKRTDSESDESYHSN
jgi:CcmD family protein